MTDQLTFVRNQMLPPQEPPIREAGVVKWLRENLFSGPLNSVLTILGLLALYWVLSNALPWLLPALITYSNTLPLISIMP